jgi:hypothetical protein
MDTPRTGFIDFSLIEKERIVENGLTNEFVDMDTYQVLIQTLQLSERIRTGPEYSQKV